MELNLIQALLLLTAIGAIAFLYSSVGHGGATGYLAIMALLGVAPVLARTGALWLNCFVAAIACWRFVRAGFFNKRLFLLLAVASTPMAWLGSRMHLQGRGYAWVLGLTLLAAGFSLGWGRKNTQPISKNPVNWSLALPVGAALGFLSGLTGIGGGVFLTPLLIFLNWAPSKTAGGISAAFILVNSVSGLAAMGDKALAWNSTFALGLVIAICAAWIGSYSGVRLWNTDVFRKVLAAVLWIAALKLLFSSAV